MKTLNGWAVLGLMGCMACGGSGTTQTPVGTGTREAAVYEASNTDCDNYDRCEQIGPGKQYADAQDCGTQRSSFWNDRWAAADCEAKINTAQVQTCLDALATIDCNNLTEELKVINTQCAKADICSGDK